jgi:hypothetical protein
MPHVITYSPQGLLPGDGGAATLLDPAAITLADRRRLPLRRW